MNVTFAGNKLTLIGNQVNVGDKLPNATLLNNGLEPTELYSFDGVKLISVVPSLDTEVCDLQTRAFNSELENVTVLTISNDLPFAQARWCGASGLDNVVTLSDYKDNDFGSKFGTLIEELKLQTRAVILANANNEIVYVEYLDEITNHPNYDKVKEALANL